MYVRPGTIHREAVQLSNSSCTMRRGTNLSSWSSEALHSNLTCSLPTTTRPDPCSEAPPNFKLS